MTPILVGGLMRHALNRKYEDAGETGDGVSILAEKREQGVLYASGLIAGAALVGVLIGGAIFWITQSTGNPDAASIWQLGHRWMDDLVQYSSWVVGAGAFAGLCWLLWRAANREEPA